MYMVLHEISIISNLLNVIVWFKNKEIVGVYDDGSDGGGSGRAAGFQSILDIEITIIKIEPNRSILSSSV